MGSYHSTSSSPLYPQPRAQRTEQGCSPQGKCFFGAWGKRQWVPVAFLRDWQNVEEAEGKPAPPSAESGGLLPQNSLTCVPPSPVAGSLQTRPGPGASLVECPKLGCVTLNTVVQLSDRAGPQGGQLPGLNRKPPVGWGPAAWLGRKGSQGTGVKVSWLWGSLGCQGWGWRVLGRDWLALLGLWRDRSGGQLTTVKFSGPHGWPR